MGSILGDRVPTQKTAKPMRRKNSTRFQPTNAGGMRSENCNNMFKNTVRPEADSQTQLYSE
jgi:hypothetical protein